MPPAPDVDVQAVILTALFNPAVIAVAFWMGRQADQWQKVPVAAFAGALIGSALIYIAVRLGFGSFVDVSRAAAGVFVAEFMFGLVWAAIGFRFKP
jgi:glycerol uptake facilitator-like aquaporin